MICIRHSINNDILSSILSIFHVYGTKLEFGLTVQSVSQLGDAARIRDLSLASPHI